MVFDVFTLDYDKEGFDCMLGLNFLNILLHHIIQISAHIWKILATELQIWAI